MEGYNNENLEHKVGLFIVQTEDSNPKMFQKVFFFFLNCMKSFTASIMYCGFNLISMKYIDRKGQ